MDMITAAHVGKMYYSPAGTTTTFPTLRDRLLHPWSRPVRQEFWALQDVSFRLARGQVLGVIGPNGAGKSTLFKILSRITRPTTGEITLRGRVSSMLEVGTGFHPELTGRENIYLNGTILGMSRAEITQHFAAIVDFAEVAAFLDTPVKFYSSGMYMRLAFAISAFLTSEIMIIDEVLSVGDSAFQRKSLAKVRQLVREEGRTVLIVSHNLTNVAELTDQCLWLEHGRVRAAGPTTQILPRYRRAQQRLAKKALQK